jgi:hypothetical protein
MLWIHLISGLWILHAHFSLRHAYCILAVLTRSMHNLKTIRKLPEGSGVGAGFNVSELELKLFSLIDPFYF